MRSADDVDALLKARAEIDEQLRRHKNALTVLFTDVVGSTSFFERNGDTAGLVMIHRHDELAARAIQQYEGTVVKTIGDSAMAEFPNPGAAVRAAVEIERQFLKLNLTLPEDQRVEVRIGVHTGIGFRKGNDLFGDVVNVTARIVKRTAPAQILISRPMFEAVSKESDLHCRWLSKLTIDGRTEQEDIFEVVWTDAEAYRQVRERPAASSHIPPRYEVLSQIGTGGTGIVYKVRDLETSEIVALKVLKPEIASDPDVQENFKKEMCLARKITHKNVCRIHEFNRLNGSAYTSMEFIEGESLLSRLNRAGSLPLNEALEIARQICAGLREAHAQGIVHRDLKPANIMVNRTGAVKIMDFGIARMVQRDDPMTGTIVGTPSYMAPEQAELKPVSSCTDIYAVGLLLYEMVTGVAAFDGDTPVAVALKQIREYPKRPREIVPQLTRSIDAVIMKCLQKEPAKRFQSVDELEIALVKAAKARPISPWEVAINREMARAELEIRNRLRSAIENAKAFLARQDWTPLVRIQEEPKAMLGVAGLVGALTVFLFFGGWKPRTINAQTIQAASQNSAQPVAASDGTVSGFPSHPPEYSFSPIASNEIDLYEDSRSINEKELSSDSVLSNHNLSSEPATPPAASPKPARIVKHSISPVRTDERKAHSDAQSPTQFQTLASPARPELLMTVGIPRGEGQELAIDSLQPNAVPEPAIVQANTSTLLKTSGDDSKAPKLYLEVGTFKDETWANNAVDKLTQLGFHAVLIHKNLLWTQSYHVEVGPYTNQKDIAEARESLASQGFKAHPVNQSSPSIQ
ncbi:MAG: protein kinase [Candidatus Acidiferrales bacterium]